MAIMILNAAPLLFPLLLPLLLCHITYKLYGNITYLLPTCLTFPTYLKIILEIL